MTATVLSNAALGKKKREKNNDTVADLEAKLGAPETDHPPTLYDFFLTCIYRKYYLSHNLE